MNAYDYAFKIIGTSLLIKAVFNFIFVAITLEIHRIFLITHSVITTIK